VEKAKEKSGTRLASLGETMVITSASRMRSRATHVIDLDSNERPVGSTKSLYLDYRFFGRSIGAISLKPASFVVAPSVPVTGPLKIYIEPCYL
jgi:hypothetical protein